MFFIVISFESDWLRINDKEESNICRCWLFSTRKTFLSHKTQKLYIYRNSDENIQREVLPLHAHRGLGRINWMAGAINLLKNIVIWEIDLTPEFSHKHPRDSVIIPFRQKCCLGLAPPHHSTCLPSACWSPKTVILIKNQNYIKHQIF